MTGPVLVVVEHDRGAIEDTSLQAIALARALELGEVVGVVVGGAGHQVATTIAMSGVDAVCTIDDAALNDYAPEAWGDAVAQYAQAHAAVALVAAGTDRGNEVLAHIAAVLDSIFVSNITEFLPGDPATLTRVRWGGSLLEHARLDTGVDSGCVVLSSAPHAFSAPEARDNPAPIQSFVPSLRADAARTQIVDRISMASGITLQTAPVVVSGGRGVGSADGFAHLEALAELLGGAVGCSRVVTNQGWRPHSDQVGQTGKRVAPELYIACGISGAIQHWIGMQAAQRVLAINLDKDAPMVTKADYAVIGDLHEIVPAIVDELRKRRA
jgi:electron transfer flavoprotein alpha subunit